MDFDERERFARIDDAFPVSFARLQAVYSNFTAKFEPHRDSFRALFESAANPTFTLRDLEPHLTNVDATSSFAKPIDILLQRYFYWSAASFYRAFYLFLSFLHLESRPVATWGHVTAYYSRFYTAQALTSLFLGHLVFVDRRKVEHKKDASFLVYGGRDGVRLRRRSDLARIWHINGSHQMTWALFDQLRFVPDMPDEDGFSFALTDAYFNPQSRNEANYSEVYLEGFKELEWFDCSEQQMQGHFNIWRPRLDMDITDIDRFFEGVDPEQADPGDFYGDDAQVVWLGLRLYLHLLASLKIGQAMVTQGKLSFLIGRIVDDVYPEIASGLRRSIEETGIQK